MDVSKYKEVTLYSRFSSRLQASGTSEERQSDAGAAFAAEHGITFSSRRIDRAKSGSKGANLEEGAELRAIIDGIASGSIPTPHLLVIERQDRFGRLPPTKALGTMFSNLLDRGCDLFHLQEGKLYSSQSVNDSFGDLVTLAATVHAAHGYAVLLSERSLAAHKKAREKLLRGDLGVRPNWAPRWIDWDPAANQWVLNGYREVVLHLLELVEGGLGQIRVAAALNAAGHLTPKGKAWTAGSVSHVLYSPAVAGGREVQRRTGQIAWGSFPEVVSRARWEAIKSEVASRDNAQGRRGPQGTMRWLAQGATFCTCGQVMGHRSASCMVQGEKLTISYLRCRGRIKSRGKDAQTCNQPALRMDSVQAHVLTRLQAGQWRELFPESTGEELQRLRLAAARAARERDEAVAMARVVDQELAGARNDPAQFRVVLRHVAEAETAAEVATQRALAAAGAVEQAEAQQTVADIDGLLNAAADLLGVFAKGEDTAADRQQINQLVRRLSIRITIDAVQELVGLAVGDGEPDWQPLAPRARAAALRRGAVDPSAIDTPGGGYIVVDWDGTGTGEVSNPGADDYHELD